MLTFKLILAFCVEQIVLWKTFDKIGLNSIILDKQAQCSFFYQRCWCRSLESVGVRKIASIQYNHKWKYKFFMNPLIPVYWGTNFSIDRASAHTKFKMRRLRFLFHSLQRIRLCLEYSILFKWTHIFLGLSVKWSNGAAVESLIGNEEGNLTV